MAIDATIAIGLAAFAVGMILAWAWATLWYDFLRPLRDLVRREKENNQPDEGGEDG